MHIEDNAEAARRAIEAYEKAAAEYAEKVAEEMRLEAGRAVQKVDAILRVKATSNPLNPEKPHSVSSAEAQVEVDPIYFAYITKQWRVVLEKNGAHTEMTSARLRAELAITLIRAEVGAA